MNTYEKYKDSGIEWLGQIPEHWNSFINKRVLNLLTDYTANGSFGDLAKNVTYLDEGYARVVRLTDLRLDLKNDGVYINKSAYEYLQKSKLFGGELVVANVGANVGTVCIIPETNELKTLGPNMFLIEYEKNLYPKYVLYLLQSNFSQSEFKIVSTTTAQPKLNKDQFRSLNILVPPLPEQTAIAQYLDEKTQAIDKKTELLQQKISYYKELRKSIINQAITKGLNGDVKLQMTDLEISVPINWKQFRLKDIGKLYSGLSGKSGDDFNQDDNENNKGFIPFTNILANTYISNDNIGTVVIAPSEKQNVVRKNDLFFLMSSEGYEDIGKSALLDHHLVETYLNSFCKGFRITNKSCNPYFLNYLLQSKSYRQLMTIEGKGFTRINLKMEKVTDFPVYLPIEIQEQTAIANYLDEKTVQIDAIVSNIEQQIEKLAELRKTLINDVVTGRIKVTLT